MHALDTLRFSTAGSVDDGKSTLIGRLLFDAHGILDDQLRTLESATSKHGHVPVGEAVDFSLLTDGLIAEREQGITIDVAYRYFTTAKRRFIIADTPGHEQYTRNMVTGASTADLTIILIDAVRGLTRQSHRHAVIASLLRIPHVVVAINKMDLVDYDEAVFTRLSDEFRPFLDALDFNEVTFIPISALRGEMLVNRGAAMPWYHGETLLTLLESTNAHLIAGKAFRFPVQRVAKAKFGAQQNLRGYQGRIDGGTIQSDETVRVMPGGQDAVVTEILHFGKSLMSADEGQSVTLVLDRQLDISRGDMLVASANTSGNMPKPLVDIGFSADLCWFDQEPLEMARRYWIKHNTQLTKVMLTEIGYRLNIETLAHETLGSNALTLNANDIARVTLSTQKPLVFDAYRDNRVTGSFILIDETTNRTVAAGMIV